jgi:hypothetical protein
MPPPIAPGPVTALPVIEIKVAVAWPPLYSAPPPDPSDDHAVAAKDAGREGERAIVRDTTPVPQKRLVPLVLLRKALRVTVAVAVL